MSTFAGTAQLRLAGCIAVLLCLSAITAGRWAAPGEEGKEYVPGQVIVKFRAHVPLSERASMRRDLRGMTIKRFPGIEAELLSLEGLTVQEAIGRYRGHCNIEYIEPNYYVEADVTPNDPMFDNLWGLRNTGQTGGTADADIDADNAWDVGTGSHDVLVGVIDTGVDYAHPDLAANMWTNPGEIPGNGADDDGNGFIDDVRGWDFFSNDNDPMDDHGHGTHCAGTIGAVGDNGIGVAGVNWNVSIVGIKFLGSTGSGTLADAIASIEYAMLVGVDVMSNSWGAGGYSAAMEEAISDAYEAGVLFVASAGNRSRNTDRDPHYPSCYNVGNVVSVASTDHNDELAGTSNWGLATVDLGAPGVDILSTLPGGTYGYKSGTSMATPHVSGVAAWIWSLYPRMTVDFVKTRLIDMADPVPDLAGRCVSGGRLNAFMCVAEPDSTPPTAIMDLASYDPTSNSMHLRWTATGDDGHTGTASYYEVRYSTSPITEESFHDADRAGDEPDPQSCGSLEEMEAGGLDFNTTYYFAIKAFDEFGNASPISNTTSGSTLGVPEMAYSPASFAESLLTGEVSTQTLTLFNEAEGTLDFTVPVVQLVFSPSTLGDYLELEKGEVDPRPGILGSGGPDGFGYGWVDSDAPGGPVFDWVDITSVGTSVPLSGDDNTAGPFPIGFTFPFYEGSFDEFNICTNGFISFTSEASTPASQPLPNRYAPENLVAPFWEDLDFGATQCAYMYNDGSRLIIQYDGVSHFDSGGPYTFELILYPSGEILFQYLYMTWPTNRATVGIQNATKDDGLQVAFNMTYVHDGLAVGIAKAPQWLSVSPTSGRIYEGDSMGLDVDFDAAGLIGGDYDANILITSNDPDEGLAVVPVTLQVTGVPDVAVSPASLEFGEIFVGYPESLTVTVKNEGTGSLTLMDVYTGISDFQVSGPPIPWVIARGSDVELEVVFTPTAAGSYTDVLTIESDDPDDPAVAVPLSGSAVIFAPDATVTPTSLDFGPVFLGYSETLVLTVLNEGYDVLSVTDVVSSDVHFVPDVNAFDLDPGSSRDLAATMAPTSVDILSASLTIYSNDPDEPEIAVEMTGWGLVPPEVGVAPDSVYAVVHPEVCSTKPLVIYNTGGSDLSFKVGGHAAYMVEGGARFGEVEEAVLGALSAVSDGGAAGSDEASPALTSSQGPVIKQLPETGPWAQHFPGSCSLRAGGRGHAQYDSRLPGEHPLGAQGVPRAQADSRAVSDREPRAHGGPGAGAQGVPRAQADSRAPNDWEPQDHGVPSVKADSEVPSDWEPQAQGGPDSFGHSWVDSDEPGGPAFEWVDITAVGTPIPMSGAYKNTGPYPIGFDFPFYGTLFDSFRISTNGFISFTDTGHWHYNRGLPTFGYGPRNLVAAWWDELNFGQVERAYYYNDGTRLIVEYVEVTGRYGGGGPYTFEIILYPDGRIVLQYLSMGYKLNSATIGIQNAPRDDGLEICYNAAYVHDNLAIEISAPSWLGASPRDGVVAAGESLSLEVIFDASGMAEGEYEARIDIVSNDPATPTVSVPVHMAIRVIEGACLDVDPNTLNLGSQGRWITGYVELPQGFDPGDVVISSVLFEYAVGADRGHYSIGDHDGNGISDLMLKFPRAEVESVLEEGENVAVTVVGEIVDMGWFTSTDTIRVIRPHLAGMESPLYGGELALVRWAALDGCNVDHYSLYFSSDGGDVWDLVGDDIEGTCYTWTVPVVRSKECVLRLYAHNNRCVIGSDTSDEPFEIVVRAGGSSAGTPREFVLFQNEPNPALGFTAIRFELPGEARVSLKIFDATGKLIRTLSERRMPPGRHSLAWDGRNDRGQKVSAGVYFYSFEAGEYKAAKKLMLVQ